MLGVLGALDFSYIEKIGGLIPAHKEACPECLQHVVPYNTAGFSSDVSPARGRRLLVLSLCRGGQQRVFACQRKLKL